MVQYTRRGTRGEQTIEHTQAERGLKLATLLTDLDPARKEGLVG